jgi:hypothetical protein
MPSKKHFAWYHSFHGFGHSFVAFLKSPLVFFKDFWAFLSSNYLAILGLWIIALIVPVCGAASGLGTPQNQADLISAMVNDSGATEGGVFAEVGATRNSGSYFSFASSELSYLQVSFYQPRFFATYLAYQEKNSKDETLDYSPFRVVSLGDVPCLLLDNGSDSYWANNLAYSGLTSQTAKKSVSSDLTPIILSPKLADYYLQLSGLATYNNLVGTSISSSAVSGSKASTKTYVVSSVLKSSEFDNYFGGYFAILPFATSFAMNQSLAFTFINNARTNHDIIQAVMGKFSTRGLYYQFIQYTFSYHFLARDSVSGLFEKGPLDEKIQKLDAYFDEEKALNITIIGLFSGAILLLLNATILAHLLAKNDDGIERSLPALFIGEALLGGLGFLLISKIGSLDRFAQMGLTFIASGSMYVMFIFIILFLLSSVLAAFVGTKKKEKLALSVEDI